ncbi:hypothetical protein JCGZ_01578 [Jatropha curcas]|uniref:Uncharacterized protein n=1 Tax=Jatropha curcas TaxID=180498 RepID=A0A067LCV8_JATCU|nr:hypothetical protein JCGZ_01578 [Jatropha curcas]
MENLSPDFSSLPVRKRLKKPKAIGCSTVSSTVPKNEEKAASVSTVLSLSSDYSRENSNKKSKIVSQTALPELSTELTHFNQSWIADIQRTSCQQHAVVQEPASCNSCNLERMKFYTAEDLEEERRKGVSTNLRLSYGYKTVNILDNNLDRWKIKKKLNKSDLGNFE